MKKCNHCEVERELKDFNKDKSKKDGLRSICKNCTHKKQKIYYNNNKTTILEKKFKYYERTKDQKKEYGIVNKDKIRKRQKQYEIDNRQKLNQQKSEYRKNRRKNDIDYRLRHNLRGLTYKAMTRGYKSASTQELLGCTWEEARIHIENQFVDGMNWENYGEWEIDHIRPCASFNLIDPEQQKICFHYTNLRPLWINENRSKGSLWNGIRYRNIIQRT